MYNTGDILERIIISNTDRMNPIFRDDNIHFLIVDKREYFLEVSGKCVVIYTLMSLKSNQHHTTSLRDTRNWKKVA